jgi:ABC-type dipeptide/oligopeptide/nickel transport system permease subunit
MDGWYGTRPVLLISICNVVLGIMAVIGGISAIRRKWFSISLAGAVGALFTVPLGILAVIFVVLGKREFEAKV